MHSSHTPTHSLPNGVSAWCTHTRERGRQGERERGVVVFPTTRTHTHRVPTFHTEAWLVAGICLRTNKRLSGAVCWLAAAYSLPLSMLTYICATTYIHTYVRTYTNHNLYSLHIQMDECVVYSLRDRDQDRTGQDRPAQQGKGRQQRPQRCMLPTY